MKTEEKFDIYQGHGDHIDCILSDKMEGTSVFAATVLPEIVKTGCRLAHTSEPVANSLGDGFPDKTDIFLIGLEDHRLRAVVLIAAENENHGNTVVSAYPEYDGTDVEIELTAIHEWANGIEATLEGTMLEGRRDIAFFDTRYAFNKNSYRIGEKYHFTLAAFAYTAHTLTEKERWIVIEGSEAEDWYNRVGKKIGWNAEFDNTGKIKPVKLDKSRMVAFFTGSVAYPDDCEFQSPVFGDCVRLAEFHTDFLKINIAIARDENDEKDDIVIPLIAKESLFEKHPAVDDPITGRIWLQGSLADIRQNKSNKKTSLSNGSRQ